MKRTDDYCPVAKSVEVLGDRWCLLLVREMLRGVDRFNEFERSVPGSPGRSWPSASGTWNGRGSWTGAPDPTGAPPATG